ncbi:hypothetical protein LUZ63_018780 [Rhynchospora breviuscula]|uniref:GATA-type domain-containing protein n=1 Tax=Rhynchospora breviuscula TaxID=2022672 RepID=A0A9Q0HJ36_9POAL|nr:hypothetical protein LUZ63_018780 [Rhynchospora breviuscula]
MEASAGTKGYVEEIGVDLFDQIDDLLEFPNDEELLIDMDHMVGSSGSADECLLPIDAPSVAPHVENNYEPMLLLLPENAFLSETQGDVSNGSGLIKVDDVLKGEEEHLGPCDELDMTQLEWLSNFFYETPSASSFPVDNAISTVTAASTPNIIAPEPIKVERTITIPTPTLAVPASGDIAKEDQNLLFCTSSPVSVLEQTSYSGGSSASSSVSSSSSFSSSNNFSRDSLSPRSVAPPEPNFVIPARPRSKRSRPASFSPRNHVIVPFLPPSSETQPVVESIAESDPASVFVPVHVSVPTLVLPHVQVPAPVIPPAKKKKKAAKKASYGDDEAEWGEIRLQTTAVRRCMHCQIEKTPQWRAGPMGPKTLCNACGVRYKSGRLFPEYRPAASPTFVPSIHSNSHKKVVEMRLKATESTPTRGCDLLELIRLKE